jgi:UDP-glucose 4-epimerase
MTILITGGAGFIGSHLAERFMADGAAVRVLDDLSSGRAENLPKGAELLVGDVADAETV